MKNICVQPRPSVINLHRMTEDEPEELARIDADAEADLPDIEEMLHGLPRTIPDLPAAIAALDARLAHKRAEFKACLDRCDDGDVPDFIRELRHEIDALALRRADYVAQLSQKN